MTRGQQPFDVKKKTSIVTFDLTQISSMTTPSKNLLRGLMKRESRVTHSDNRQINDVSVKDSETTMTDHETTLSCNGSSHKIKVPHETQISFLTNDRIHFRSHNQSETVSPRSSTDSPSIVSSSSSTPSSTLTFSTKPALMEEDYLKLLREVVSQCIKPDPGRRPSAQEIHEKLEKNL